MGRQLITIVLVAFVLLVAGACGQKGDLYLPGSKYTAHTSGHQQG